MPPNNNNNNKRKKKFKQNVMNCFYTCVENILKEEKNISVNNYEI